MSGPLHQGIGHAFLVKSLLKKNQRQLNSSNLVPERVFEPVWVKQPDGEGSFFLNFILVVHHEVVSCRQAH